MGTVYKMNPQRKAKRKTKRISVAPTWNLCICHVMLSRQGYKWINGLSVGVTEMQNEVLNEHVMDTTSKGRWSALSYSVFVFLLFLVNCAFVFVFAFRCYCFYFRILILRSQNKNKIKNKSEIDQKKEN